MSEHQRFSAAIVFCEGSTPEGADFDWPVEGALECGAEYRWENADEIPRETTECMCGKLDHPHYFIYYQQ